MIAVARQQVVVAAFEGVAGVVEDADDLPGVQVGGAEFEGRAVARAGGWGEGWGGVHAR